MTKISLIIFVLVSSVFTQNLQVSENGRYIIHSNGEPFFYLGDTAWELFHRLSKEEAEHYLKNRAEKGFNVIQAVILAELKGLTIPNVEGELPLVDMDPTKPNEKYFEHVDWIVQKANDLGMVVGLLPTWGDKFNIKWGVGPEIFTPENAKIFGEYVGNRYKGNKIIWILGGDRNPENKEDLQIIDAMALGLEIGHDNSQLMTYHPQGGSNSSTWFHNKEWLDFNMFQSGHSHLDDSVSYQYNLQNYSLKPVKPTLNGEPCYEDHPINWFRDGENRWFSDNDTRKAAYWSLFAGAAGHTFGNHNIWQMWEADKNPISWARTNWKIALNYPGALQVQILKEFMEGIGWYRFKPDQNILVGENNSDGNYKMAMVNHDQSIILAYTPTGDSISVNIGSENGVNYKSYWFNPRDGVKTISVGKIEGKILNFTPSSKGIGSDWILVIEKLLMEKK